MVGTSSSDDSDAARSCQRRSGALGEGLTQAVNLVHPLQAAVPSQIAWGYQAGAAVACDFDADGVHGVPEDPFVQGIAEPTRPLASPLFRARLPLLMIFVAGSALSRPLRG